MNRLLHVFLLFVLTQALSAQSICHQVVSALGQSANLSQGVQLEFTVGESIITTIGTGSLQLTQGFHQPETCVGIVSTQQAPQPIWQAVLAPNPAATTLQLSFTEPLTSMIFVRILDVNGRVVALYTPGLGAAMIEIDASHLARGVYLLTGTGSHYQGVLQIPFVLI